MLHNEVCSCRQGSCKLMFLLPSLEQSLVSKRYLFLVGNGGFVGSNTETDFFDINFNIIIIIIALQVIFDDSNHNSNPLTTAETRECEQHAVKRRRTHQLHQW